MPFHMRAIQKTISGTIKAMLSEYCEYRTRPLRSVGIPHALVLAATLLFCDAVTAQDFSYPVQLGAAQPDSNGVDVVSDTLYFPLTDVSIGPRGIGGIAVTHTSPQFPFLDNFSGSINNYGSGYNVQIGMTGDYFSGTSIPAGGLTSSFSTGAVLTQSGTLITYATTDGMQYVFDTGITSQLGQSANVGLLKQILAPTGDNATIRYAQTTLQQITSTTPLTTSSDTWARRQSVVTTNGYQVIYTYNADTIANNDTTNPDFTDWSLLTKVTLINNAVQYYDPAANGSGCTTACANWPSATYVTNGGTLTDTNANGDAWQFTFGGTATAPVITIVPPPNNTTRSTISINGTSDPNTGVFLVSSYNNGSVIWNYSRNDSASGVYVTRTLTVTDPINNATVYTSYQNYAHLMSIQDPLGHVTNYSYYPSNTSTGNGYLETVAYPEGNQVQYQYDAVGNVTQTTLIPATVSGVPTPANVVTSATYPTPVNSACANFVVCHKPLTTTDALGNVTTYLYDTTATSAFPNGTGNLLSVTFPAGSNRNQPQTRLSYQTQTATLLGASGTVTSSPMSRLVGTSQCASTAFTNSSPACATSTDEITTVISYASSASTYNVLPSSSTLTGPGNTAGSTMTATNSTTYDNFGNALTVTNPVATTAFVYDALQRVVGVMTPQSASGVYRALQTQYNHDGTVASVSQGTVTNQTSWSSFSALEQQSFTYDTLGRRTEANVAVGGVSQTVLQYSYDADNRPACAALRMNPSAFGSLPGTACSQGAAGSYGPDRISQNNYDADSRLTSIYQGVGTSLGAGTTGQITAQTLNYKPSNNLLTSVADAKGNTTSYVYDGLNRRYSRTWPISPRPGAASATTVARQYVYDNLGRIINATANGQTLSYTYNALGEVTSETQPAGTVTYAYDAAGRRTSMTWPDSISVSYNYDATNELLSIAAGSTTLASFTYDSLGRRSTLVRGSSAATSTYSYSGAFLSSLALSLAGTPADNQTYSLTYNPAGQVVGATFSNQAYDVTGSNRTLSYSPNALNQITVAGSASLAYDGLGNLTSTATLTYSYDPLSNFLTSSAGGSLAYDPIGRITTATSSAGTASQFLYDGGHVIAEYGGASVTQRYVFGPGVDEPLVWYSGSTTTAPQYLIADQRGSIVAVTNASGMIVGSVNTYDEYGTPASSNTGRFQYTGQMWMAEVGLYSYKTRLYSPALGRFLQTDRTGYGNGMNLYAYAGSDPINNVDPSGMSVQAVKAWINILGNWMGCTGCGGAWTQQTMQVTYGDGTKGPAVPYLVWDPNGSSGGFGGGSSNQATSFGGVIGSGLRSIGKVLGNVYIGVGVGTNGSKNGKTSSSTSTQNISLNGTVFFTESESQVAGSFANEYWGAGSSFTIGYSSGGFNNGIDASQTEWNSNIGLLLGVGLAVDYGGGSFSITIPHLGLGLGANSGTGPVTTQTIIEHP